MRLRSAIHADEIVQYVLYILQSAHKVLTDELDIGRGILPLRDGAANRVQHPAPNVFTLLNDQRRGLSLILRVILCRKPVRLGVI